MIPADCGSDTLIAIETDMCAIPATIPTMTEWAMILFGLILAGGAAMVIHRRRLAA